MRNSKLLNSVGIVGIEIPIDLNGSQRYEGSNYVIFNEDDLVITDHMRFSKEGNPIQEVGEFGPILREYENKPEEAIERLLELKDGEATNALHHKDIGGISIVYGSDKGGLKKIAEKHSEVMDNLQGLLDEMEINTEKSGKNRYRLESPTHFTVVSRDFLGTPRAPWLLSAFEKKNSALDNTMDTGETPKGSEQNDTATPQDTVSDGKNKIISDNSNDSDIFTDSPDILFSIRTKPAPMFETKSV